MTLAASIAALARPLLPQPTVAVVILNWNGRSFLNDCLSALQKQDYPPSQIILVDNASSDDSVAWVQQQFPQVLIQQNSHNVGFSAGNNAALRQHQADITVLMNPDITVAPNWVGQMVAAMQADPAIGIAGCKLYYPGGSVLQHAGGFITHPLALPGHFGIHEPDTGQHDLLREVDYVIGAATAVRREVWQTVGLFDEGYFLYFEDADLCARARQTGFRVVYVPQAVGIHVESAVAGKGSPTYLQHFHSGRWRYLLKQFAPDDILAATIPAERVLLQRADLTERGALLLAYRTALRQLPLIWQARLGNEFLGQQQQIAQQLQALCWLALQPLNNAMALAELEKQAQVVERPFASNTPLIGPLIVRFRTAWNNVAARWYTRLLFEQQNRFNQQVVERLREHDAWLNSQQRWWLEQEMASPTPSTMAELLTQIDQLSQTAQKLEERIASWEQSGNTN